MYGEEESKENITEVSFPATVKKRKLPLLISVRNSLHPESIYCIPELFRDFCLEKRVLRIMANKSDESYIYSRKNFLSIFLSSQLHFWCFHYTRGHIRWNYRDNCQGRTGPFPSPSKGLWGNWKDRCYWMGITGTCPSAKSSRFS